MKIELGSAGIGILRPSSNMYGNESENKNILRKMFREQQRQKKNHSPQLSEMAHQNRSIFSGSFQAAQNDDFFLWRKHYKSKKQKAKVLYDSMAHDK